MPESAQEAMRRMPAIRPWRNVERGATDANGREMYLYVQAAPVFEQHGYKGATIKVLAHACHLSPSSLYHYVGSREKMAVYPLTATALTWENTYVDPDMDPLEQLHVMLALAVAMFPIWTLALRMRLEIDSSDADRVRSEGFKQGEAVFGRLVVAAAPRIERADAERLARDVLATLAGTAFAALDEDVMGTQIERMTAVLRAGLVPGHVKAEHFDGIMSAPLEVGPTFE